MKGHNLGVFAAAIITRDPNPKIVPFPPNSTPLILPPDPAFIHHWLSSAIDKKDSRISQALDGAPRLYCGATVTPVKSYVRGEPLGDPIYIEADAA